MKKIVAMILTISLILGITGCANKEITPVSRETFALGTIIDFKVYDKDQDKSNQVIDECIERIKDIEKKMSANMDNSEVTNVNKNAGKESVEVSNETMYVAKKSLEYSRITNGKFNLTVYPLVNLWGIGTENARVPSQSEIDQAISNIDYNDAVFDETENTIYLKRENQGIDLGAIAKGYVGDEIKKIFVKNDIKSAFVNLGGNVMAYETKVDGSKWRIGIQNPLDTRGEYLGVISVKDKSIVTSGNYERYFEQDGKRYHHILDATIGYPADAGLISTSIITESGIDADALSTSVYLMGLDEGMKLIESIDGVDAIFVTKDKEVYTTSGLKDNFELTNEEFTYKK
ncbi:FAD:protein FMN transferase [Tepidibacter hydrothermalis]|uniref:FAD:protein FMN transferase n=1 Tax=Tepidibacter hydrothermalis TaxID=3036126 RepID=A0ABY8EEG5_9FIRM|nr:FAD:protein FMN transferase [Tepidibacter hydrothermalis]WFD11330.1 FAD:protein FMN transferase [Tepidibacter hydrothermalis]